MIDKIERSVKVYNQNGKRAAKELSDERSVKHIRGDIKTCLEYGDEKVALAVQTYELVCVILNSKKLKKIMIYSLQNLNFAFNFRAYFSLHFPFAFLFLMNEFI